jgi:hypothetical protein
MHLIDDRFTRLKPGTDFRHLDETLSLEVPAFLAPVPEQWHDIHDPLLVAHWHARLIENMRHPVQVEKHRSGHRHVMLLGDAIYDISSNGTVQCFAWRHEGDGLVRLRAFPDNEIVALNAPYQGLWMRGYAQGALQRLCRVHPPQLHDHCEAYAAWLMDQMLAEHWQPDVAAQVRKQLASAMDLDPDVQQLAATMCRAFHPNMMRLSEYNHCVVHRDRVERLQAQAPQLAMLYSLLYPDLSLELEATQAMRVFLQRQGLGRGLWRLLVQHGSQWMQPLLAFYRLYHGENAAVAVDMLRLAQMFGTQQLVPHEILCALMAVAGNPNRRRATSSYAQEFAQIEDLMARVGQIYANAGPAERLYLLDQCNAIFNWGFSHWAGRTERSRRSIRLVGLIREVKAHQRRLELTHRDQAPWPMPWTLTSMDPAHEVQILDSALAVCREALGMRHCAEIYIDRCASGRYLMVSIRPANTGRIRRFDCTTAGFVQKENGFVLHNISGFANAKVTQQALAIARDCLRQLNDQVIQQALDGSHERVVDEEAEERNAGCENAENAENAESAERGSKPALMEPES